MWSQLSGDNTPDLSSCSSDTGDVLIRSTRVLLSDPRPEAGSGVHITVQKLWDPPVRDPPPPVQNQPVAEQQQRPKPRRRPDGAAPQPAAFHLPPDRRTPMNPEPTKENRRPPSAESSSPNRNLSAGHNLLTSRFAAGGRGVVLAALKQRSHSAPLRREVKVQLLDPDPPPTSSKDAVGVSVGQMEAGLPSGSLDNATIAAAAAISAAAPLIKSHSDLEARVCQLADAVENLLQADREGGDSGRSLSQQTLQHLEKLHSQQMQLQSQLLQSALRMVTGHAPVNSDLAMTSDLTSSASFGQLPCLQVRHLDPAENVLSSQQNFSVTAMETGPVSMATTHHDQRPKETRDDRYHRGVSRVSRATRPAAGSCPQSSANHSKAAARRANEMLSEMGRLRSEMKTLLTKEDSLNTTRPGPNQHQTQPQSQSSQSKSQQNQSQTKQSRSTPLQSQSQPVETKSDDFRPEHSQSLQPNSKLLCPQSQPSTSQQTKPQQSQSQQNQLQPKQNQSKSQQKQSNPQQNQSKSQQNQSYSQQNQCKSSHTKSHQILSLSSESPFHQIQTPQSSLVQRSPAVSSMLEEAGQVLRQVRSQKKVLEENLEVLLRAKTGEMLHCQLEALAANRDWTEEVRIKKTVDAWISTLSKDIKAEMASEDVTPCRAAEAVTKPSASRVTAATSQKAAGSSAHRGRVLSTLRGTGSKTASGRGEQTAGEVLGAEPVRAKGSLTDRQQVEEDGEMFLSHMYGRARYEGVRRTLKKSPYLRFSSPVSPLNKKPRPRLVESVKGVKVKSCKTQTCLAPTRTLSPGPPQNHYIISSPLTTGDPADFIVNPADRYPVPMAIPLGRPRMDSSSRCPSGRQQDVTSPAMAPPTHCGQLLPLTVNNKTPELQSQGAEQPGAGEAPPPHVDVIERRSEEEEESIFPGTDFLSVADVIQQEEVTVGGEEEVQLAGGPSPPPVLYQGPVFPPTCPSVPPSQDQTSVLGLHLQRELMENQLVEWVEQQLMSRMISEMYHPSPSDPVQNDSYDQSKAEEQSMTSDFVEAAGGTGLQLFVDSNVLVDSSLIRHLVNEVLSEQVALMLGTRDTQEPVPEPGPIEPTELGPEVNQEDKLVALVPTPVPTPPPSPTMPIRETLPLTTPPPSETTSLLEESPQPITAAEPIATPTSSPEPAHPAESSHDVNQALPPPALDDAELPLDEESPEEHLDTHPQPLLMTVAEEEPPQPPPSIPPGPRPESSCSSSEESSSSSSSSSCSSESAETEAVLKHISEGELLVSINQLAAVTDADAVCSFSSSLQECQDMDFDPPSEGQVRGHDLLLTLLTKMEQGVKHTHRGERPQPEGSWGREEEVSMGEVREDPTTKPHRTTNPESLGRITEALQGQTSSPGQISADVSEVCFEETNQDLFAMGDLMVEPISTLTSDLLSDLSTSPPHLEDTRAAEQAGTYTGGARKRDVHLPSIAVQEEHQEEETVVEKESLSAAGDTDSSVSDIF
ncbi:protein TALPID3 isoform X1 [Labrus bergylta]|uniref:protein TALPID3 isoform X1 n=1 Tax=Labrus bergylta TaxID=56723 RepID=UPI003313E7E8